MIDDMPPETRPARVPAGSRIRLKHHRIELPDGRRVGVSVGGHGVPLVFFHGIGMNRQVYLRLLSRLPQLGFVVVALDAPGHGDTFLPARGARSFAARMAATNEILDALGIRQALLVGHSMGGRTAAELAASRPERALAIVLIDPALGEAFDASRDRITSPVEATIGLAAGMLDMVRDRVGLRRFGVVRHLSMLAERSLTTIAHPRMFLSAATAIAQADHSAHALGLLRDNAIPVAVVHGERDMVVPLSSAVDVAQLSKGTLVTLPKAYHSWVLPSPWTFVQILQQLVARGLLGAELRSELNEVRRNGTNAAISARYLVEGSAVLDLAPPVQVIGSAYPRNEIFYHDYRIWERMETQ
ncbi:alpha/beta fold hydrolase [Mycobacterium sp.]|uniref:alpha/beta fold hydrolase n=1 Tax=Mycobacterium sp. TaxID=1785 RepID=UPI003F97C708